MRDLLRRLFRPAPPPPSQARLDAVRDEAARARDRLRRAVEHRARVGGLVDGLVPVPRKDQSP